MSTSQDTPPAASSATPALRRHFELVVELSAELLGRVAAAARANRQVTLTVTGLALIFFGLYVQADSALSLPLFVLGGIVVVRGVLGNRVSGNLSVDWGEEGTRISFETRILPPNQHALSAPPNIASEVTTIEGSGETIEIEVARLNELLVASGEQPTRA